MESKTAQTGELVLYLHSTGSQRCDSKWMLMLLCVSWIYKYTTVCQHIACNNFRVFQCVKCSVLLELWCIKMPICLWLCVWHLICPGTFSLHANIFTNSTHACSITWPVLLQVTGVFCLDDCMLLQTCVPLKTWWWGCWPCNLTSIPPPHHTQDMRGTQTNDLSLAWEGSARRRRVFWEAVTWPRWEIVWPEKRELSGEKRGDRIIRFMGLKAKEIYFTDTNRLPLWMKQTGLKRKRRDYKWPVLHWCAWYQWCSKSTNQCRSLLVKPTLLSGNLMKT